MRIKFEAYLLFRFSVGTLPAILLLTLMLVTASSASAASFTVNTNYDASDATSIDTNPGDGLCQESHDGLCSLRAAIMEVNALGGSNTISFNVPFSLLTLKTPLPPIGGNLTIIGPGAANLTLDGNAAVRHFFVNPGATLTISDLTLSGGVSDSGGSIYNSGGTLVVTSAVFTGNNTTTTAGMPHFGGVIYNGGTLTVASSSFSNNVASVSVCGFICLADGGAIYVTASGSAEVSNSTFNNNLPDAIGNGGSATVTTSIFTNHTSGAIGNSKSLSVSDSTFTNNNTGIVTGVNGDASTTVNRSLFTQGGVGVFVRAGELIVANSTFVNNSDPSNSGIIGRGDLSSTKVYVTNSTLANNTGYGLTGGGVWIIRNTIIAGSSIRNCREVVVNGGNNLEDGTSCGWGSDNGSMSNTNPSLGALGNFGGPALTMPLTGNSPAVNKGNTAVCSTAVGAPDYGAGTVDQRGFLRRNGLCDIGAFEAQPSNISGQGSGQSTLVNTPFASLLRVHVTDFFANVLGGAKVTFSGPASGASIAGGGTGNTEGNGNASFAATANGVAGAYKVIAGFDGGPLVNFDLTNTAASTPTPTPTPSPTPTPTATPTPTPTPTPMLIQFSSSTYQVGEGDGRVDTIITRTGDTSAAASVSFATSDLAGAQNCNLANGVASSLCDYETRLTTVRFAAGETAKVVSVLIVDDSYLEGPETFSLNLSNPNGGSLSSNANTTVTIVDNDIATGASPIDQTGFFVRMHYLDFLSRVPDSDGVVFWTNQILSCGSNQSCIDTKRTNVSSAFFLSIEFQQTGYLVEHVYKSAYGNATGTSTFGGTHQLLVPGVRLNEFLADSQQIADGVIVGQVNWQQTLENNKQAFFAELVQRPRFTSAFPSSLSAAQFVDTLNANAENPLSTSERDQLVNDLATGGKSRAQVLRAIAENSNLAKAEFNRAMVLMQYFGYLRRNPNDNPDTDYTGYDFWLTKLNQFNGDYIGAEMVKAFINSAEYRGRFGTP